MLDFYVYILKCADDSYYVGHTDDLEIRLAQHLSSEYKCYATTRLPVKLLYAESFASRAEAIDAERKIKNWSRKKKEALIEDDSRRLLLLCRKKFEK